MKNNWQTKTLGEVLEIERGGSPRPIKSFLTTAANGINWVKIGDTQGIEKYIYKTEEKIKPEGARRSRIVNDGDFILSNSMSFGRPYIMRTTGCIHDGWLVLRDKAKHLDQDFLYYLLSSDEVFRQFNRLAAGATVRNLNINLVRGVSISFPPLPEQRRIVAKLDDIFARIATAKANTEENLANAREVFEAELQEVFSNPGKDWKMKTIGEVAEHSLGKMLDKQKNKGNFKPYLRNLNVRWFSFDLSDVLEMRFLDSEKEKYTAVKGDLLICEGGYPGRAAIWENDEPIYFQKAVHRVRFSDPVFGKWFLYLLYLSDSNGKLKNYFSGTGIQHFTGEALHRFVLPIPPITEVRKLVSGFNALSAETKKLERQYAGKVSSLEELKKSVLRQAFSGEL